MGGSSRGRREPGADAAASPGLPPRSTGGGSARRRGGGGGGGPHGSSGGAADGGGSDASSPDAPASGSGTPMIAAAAHGSDSLHASDYTSGGEHGEHGSLGPGGAAASAMGSSRGRQPKSAAAAGARAGSDRSAPGDRASPAGSSPAPYQRRRSSSKYLPDGRARAPETLRDREQWEFPGWGQRRVVVPPPGWTERHPAVVAWKEERALKEKHALGNWSATSICGNDITSSTFYVSGLVVAAGAGKFAFVCLVIVAIVLGMYKSVYAEAVSALPINGGAYGLLLNTSSKGLASIAAALTMVSYVATAVVSADSAIAYLNELVDGAVNRYLGTLGLLGFFALLSVAGMRESAGVALAIFTVHLVTLTILVLTALVWVARDSFHQLSLNWAIPVGDGSASSIAYFIFLGYGAGMLGISGYETSANYVEEQVSADVTFPATLRNMWVAVSVFNPLLAFLCVAAVPGIELYDPDNRDSLLAHLGSVTGGHWLKTLVSVDAVLVLSGAVLTGFIGVMGLSRRLAHDRLFPTFLLATNQLRGTNHWIVLLFLALTSSMYVLLRGNTASLGGVFTIAFLSVMSLFAVGNLLLKYKRGRLPRSTKAWWGTVVLALLSTIAGLAANIVYPEQGAENLRFFVIYFAIAQGGMLLMLNRVRLLRVLFTVLAKAMRRRSKKLLEREGAAERIRQASVSPHGSIQGGGASNLREPLLSSLAVAQSSPAMTSDGGVGGGGGGNSAFSYSDDGAGFGVGPGAGIVGVGYLGDTPPRRKVYGLLDPTPGSAHLAAATALHEAEESNNPGGQRAASESGASLGSGCGVGSVSGSISGVGSVSVSGGVGSVSGGVGGVGSVASTLNPFMGVNTRDVDVVSLPPAETSLHQAHARARLLNRGVLVPDVERGGGGGGGGGSGGGGGGNSTELLFSVRTGDSLADRLLRTATAYLGRSIRGYCSLPVVYFTRTCHIAALNKAVAYIRDNELSRWVMLVHCTGGGAEDRAPPHYRCVFWGFFFFFF
jgi:amino acid transporter